MGIETSHLKSKKFWCIVLFLTFFYLFFFYVIHSKRKYPKFSKNSYGILFAINIDSEEQFELINKKFVIPFQNHCVKEMPHIETKILNSFTCKKFFEIKKDNKKLNRLISRNRCKFIIYGNSYFGNEYEDLGCKMEIDGFVNSHDSITKLKSAYLSMEMGRLWFQIREIEIRKNSETIDFATNAEQLQLIFKDILAYTFLLCDDMLKSNKLYLILYKDLQNFKADIPAINDIKRVINSRIVYTSVHLSENYLSEFYESKDKAILIKMKTCLDISLKCDGTSYDTKILLGFFYFLYNRNINKAISILDECKNEKNLVWKQNIAFLKLYSEDSIPNFLNAYKVYKKIASRNELTMDGIEQVSTFIHMVLEMEEDKKQLYFILFLLYYYTGDKELENKYFTQFAENYSEFFNNERMNDILFKMGKVEKLVIQE